MISKMTFSMLIFICIACVMILSCDTRPPSQGIPKNQQQQFPKYLSTKAKITICVNQIQKDKIGITNGLLVLGDVIAPQNITNDQIRPIALDIMKTLKKEYPQCEGFGIWISDDERMHQAGNYIAIVNYRNGQLSITGGIPSDEEIAEYKSWNIGPMMKPNNEGMDVVCEFARIKQVAHKNGTYLSDIEIYPMLAEKFKMPISKIKEYHVGISQYYMYKIGK